MKSFEGFKINVTLFWEIQKLKNPYLDWFFTHFYLLGKGWVLLPIAVWLFLFRKRELPTFFLAIFIETLTVQGLKHIFNQPRPGAFFNNFQPLEPVFHYSFPSGDTAMAFAIASFFWKRSNLYGKLLLGIYAFLIAFGRIYLGAHFPLDVLVGAIIGVFSTLLAEKLFSKRNQPAS